MKFKKRNIQIVDHSTGQTLDFPTFGKQAGEEAINELEQNVDNKIAELKSLVGTPLKASTASAMNNRDKIYVYTGNETGYTNGHWYYYDGSKWVDGGVYNSTAVETDKTLSVENVPADAKKTGDEINKLKSELTVIQNDVDAGTRTFIFDVIENSYPNASGGFDTYNGWDRSDYIPVVSGSTVYIDNPTKATNDNAYYRADKSIISRFSIPIKTPYVLNIPSDCAYIVVSNKRTAFFTKIYVLSTISEIKADAEKALSELDNIESNALTRRTSRQIFDRSKAESGYILLNGNVYPDSNTYDYYQYIYVGDHTGDTLYFSADGDAYSTRFVCAYDADKNALEAKGSQSVTTYTVPDGVAYISLSWAKNEHYQAEWSRITPTSTWFDALETKTNTAVSTVCFGGMVTKVSGDLAEGESLTLESTCSKKNNVFAFYGKISAFAGIRIGQGLGYSRGYNIHVTPTGISWQSGTTDGNPISHGLTFADYICVVIDVDNDGYGHVTLFTNGGTYKRDTTPWLGSDSNIFVTADSGTSLTECDLSYTLKDIKKPVWYFGDSYISNSESRWAHYINQLGYYKNLYMDGFSGANSAQIYTDVERLLNSGVAPKYLVWGLGMNDADDTAVNSSWLAYYTLLRDLCDQKGVQLILCTIPNTPSVNNIYKNEIVRNSGLPYIDYASAVNVSVNSSEWYDGLLSSDNVHPTVEGARALASKLINDMPIISE